MVRLLRLLRIFRVLELAAYLREGRALTRATAQPVSSQACPGCGLGAHDFDAVYCRRCGAKL